MKKKMGITVAVIGWMDASQDGDSGLHYATDIVSMSFAISSGTIIKETDDYIAISRDYFPNPMGKANDQVRAREVILKKNILWVKRYSL